MMTQEDAMNQPQAEAMQTAPAPAMPEPQHYEMCIAKRPGAIDVSMEPAPSGEWVKLSDYRAALAEQRERAEQLAKERADLYDYCNECKKLTGEQGILPVAIKRLKERAESAERTGEQLRGELAAARACIRDANKQIVGGNALWWRKEHAPAIEAANKEVESSG